MRWRRRSLPWYLRHPLPGAVARIADLVGELPDFGALTADLAAEAVDHVAQSVMMAMRPDQHGDWQIHGSAADAAELQPPSYPVAQAVACWGGKLGGGRRGHGGNVGAPAAIRMHGFCTCAACMFAIRPAPVRTVLEGMAPGSPANTRESGAARED